MATFQEEVQKVRSSSTRSVPGQSLSNDPENPAPFEKAPEYTSVHAATEYLWESFIEPKAYVGLMGSVADGVPIMNIVQIVLFNEFQKGSWNPDLMLMLVEPTAYMIMALAERLDLNITIYEGDLDDDDEEEEFGNTVIQEDRIRKLINDNKKGRIPEGVLTAEMQKSLETLPEIDVEQSALSQPSLMEEPAPEEEQPQSLMAPPTGV